MTDSAAGRRAIVWSVLAIVVAVAMVTLLPLVRREVFTFRDHFDYFEPLRYYTAARLRGGELPLWNPYNASGEVWLANPQTGVFYPPQWLFVVLPFETAYLSFLAFHLLLLGTGAAALFRRHGSTSGALFGAVVLTLSGPALSLLDVQNNLSTFAWFPWILFCASSGARNWRMPRAILAGIALAMAFLAGEPFLASIAGLMYAAALYRSRRDDVLRAAGEIALSAAVAIVLSAVQLVPFLASVAGSDRVSGAFDPIVLQQSMSGLDWLQIANPAHRSLGTGSQNFIAVGYCGLTVVLLAAWGALDGLRKRRGNAAAWLMLLGFSALASSAGHLPLVPKIIAGLGLGVVRHPSRLLILVALSLAALSVEGLELLTSRIPRQARAPALAALLLITAVDLRLHAQPLLGSMAFRTDRVPYPAAVGREAKVAALPDSQQRSWGGDSVQLRTKWMSGYLNLYQQRFVAGTAAPVVNQDYAMLLDRALYTPRFDLLERLSVGWLLTTRALAGSRVMAASRSGDVMVYKMARTLPFAFGWSRGRAVGGVRNVQMGNDRAGVDVDLAEDTIVVLNQQNTSGWEVRVDGKRAQPTRAAGLFHAVGVSRGRHHVEWIYRPRSLRVGTAITLSGMAALAAAWLLRRRSE